MESNPAGGATNHQPATIRMGEIRIWLRPNLEDIETARELLDLYTRKIKATK